MVPTLIAPERVFILNDSNRKGSDDTRQGGYRWNARDVYLQGFR